jgi:16S rRNA (cytosine1402-N4)-methyltransferase
VDEHIPVLVKEVLDGLAPQAGGLYVDATFGRGGHTAALLDAIGSQGRIIALDRDPAAIIAGQQRFSDDSRVELVQAPFAELATVVASRVGSTPINGILLDLGVSSPQLDQAERGFSFSQDGPLDMRMDPTRGESVAEWLARASVGELQRVIAEFGEERHARRIANAIVREREQAPIVRTRQLAELVQRVVPRDGKHPATRTFQGLRIFINDELGQLRSALQGALSCLAVGGRLAVISFHSLEDRIVKNFMRAHSQVDPVFAGLPVIPPEAEPALALIGRKWRAGDEELARNPRARSAVLRVAEKRREVRASGGTWRSVAPAISRGRA